MINVKKFLSRTINAYKSKGIKYIVHVGFNKYILKPFLWYYYIFNKNATFSFQKEQYKYLINKPNNTWTNERAIEVPIVWRVFDEYKGKKILELGNVLSHYSPITHDVVDKYEKADGVINKDIIDYHPRKKYDLIVSISTLEHIGWDERCENDCVGEPNKTFKAINAMKKMLAPHGKMIITFCLGYNPWLDKLVKENKLKFDKQYYLKRVSNFNKWEQVEWVDVAGIDYDAHLTAKAVVIGIIEK